MPKLYRVILPVNDMEKAQDFYEQLLDLEGQRVSPERHYFDCDGTILACYDPTFYDEKESATPNPEFIYISVADLQKTLQRAQAASAKITKEIQSYPWGETSFYIEDPFGNPLCIVAQETVFIG
jgi:predicted enzyme related to lactoylglutathione lyase